MLEINLSSFGKLKADFAKPFTTNRTQAWYIYY